MQYPAMSRGREYRVSVPQLNGGVNLAVPSHMIADNQLSDVLNMWWRNGVLKTRPALVGKASISADSNAVYRYGSIGTYGYILGTSDNAGYVALVDEEGALSGYGYGGDTNINLMLASVKSDLSATIPYRDALLYMKGDKSETCGVYSLSADNYNLKRLAPYVPKVLINGRPQKERLRAVVGDQIEPYNMLADEYVCTFTPDGTNSYYFLPECGDELIALTYIWDEGDGEKHTVEYDSQTGYYIESTINDFASGYKVTYSPLDGCFWFYLDSDNAGIPADEVDPMYAEKLPEKSDNCVIVRMRRKNRSAFSACRDTILGMRFSTWFGGGSSGLSGGTRLFISGNPQYPNLVHWSALNDPLYFPENNYAYVGDDTNAVTAFGKQSDMLVIFKEREVYYTTYMRGNSVETSDVENQAVVDMEAAAAIFPMVQLHPEIGCDCPGSVRLCNNRLVWLNGDGNVYGLFSDGVYSERNVRKLSMQLGDTLSQKHSKEELRAATATRFNEQYLLLVGNRRIYAMDFSSYGFNYYGSYSTDEKAQKNVMWHIWESDCDLLGLEYIRDTAVLIGTDREGQKLCTFLLSEENINDDIPNMSDGSVVFQQSGRIRTSFSTKQYDFGHCDRLKRVNSIYLQVSGEQGETAFLTYWNGKDAHHNAGVLTLTGDSPEATCPFCIRPNMIRVRQFGLSLTGEGHIEVGSFVLNYSMMGAV